MRNSDAGAALRSRADEIEQVGVFGFVELERLTDGLENALGDSPRVPALEPRVVTRR